MVRMASMTGALLAVALILAGCAGADADRSGRVGGIGAGQESGRVIGPDDSLCGNCGTVQSIRPVEADEGATGVGAVLGAIVGGVAGNQVGGGTGQDVATGAGAAAGAVAGHEIEENMREGDTVYEVVVGMDDGDRRTVTVTDTRGLDVGEQVRVEGGNLYVL